MSDLTSIYDIMKSACRYTGHRHTGEIGVEIETEVDTSKSYDYPKMKYWDAKPDGSLRGYGVEYVLKAPMAVGEFKEAALKEFSAVDQKLKFNKGSISTSVHVHLNFQNDTYRTMVNFITAYVLTENLLIRFSGPDRLSNLFCLPFCDAEGVRDHYKNAIANIQKRNFARIQFNQERVKYAALNPCNLTTLGTIEVRSFRGETDPEVIQQWVDILMKLKEFSRRDITPMDIIEMLRNYGASTFVDMIYGDYSKYLKVGKETEDLVYGPKLSNLITACEFAASCKDWRTFGILKIKPIYREKAKEELEAIAQQKFKHSFDKLQFPERMAVYEIYHSLHSNTKIVDILEDM